MNGNVEVVDKLLQHGARVDLQAVVRSLFFCTLCEGPLEEIIYHYLTDVGCIPQLFNSSKCFTKSQSRCEYRQ